MSVPAACSLVAVLALLPEFSLAQAVIEGRVELPKSRAAPVMTKRYEIVAKGGVVATSPPVAVVYLEGAFPRAAGSAAKQMSQKDFAFVPPLLPVQTGTKVEFPNFDDTYHNIFSYPPAKRFDLGRYRVTLRCDIHEHMRGLILVLDTPHFVITDTEGRFRLGGLPAGSFRLKAWLNTKTTLEKALELKSGATLHVDLP